MRILWVSGIVIFIDQLCKLTVVKTMYKGQSIPVVGDWLKLTFTENPGMAFGITFGPPSLITIFSIIATVIIVLYMISVRKGFLPYRISLGLVLGGAVGNIIDRVFFGRLFDYAPFFEGRVVDFIHVNLWRGYIAEAIPVFGGRYLALFPIWNVADMAIVLGVVGILVFQKAFHRRLNPDDTGDHALPSDMADAARAATVAPSVSALGSDSVASASDPVGSGDLPADGYDGDPDVGDPRNGE